MKNILKTLSLLIAFITIAGTLTIQAAPEKIQLTPKGNLDTKIVMITEDPDIILYIPEKDKQELNNGKEIMKFKLIIESKKEKDAFSQMFQPLTKTGFWALGVGIEINVLKRTLKFNDIQCFDQTGEIIVHIGDIYIKNYEVFTLEQILGLIANSKNKKQKES